MQSLEYSSEKIYQLKLNEKQDLFLHHSGDLYLISGDRIALEAAIRQKNSPTQVAENDRLRQIRESRNPRSPLNIYLNLKSWPDYLSTLGKLKTQFLADMGDWLLLDLDAETHDLIATGLLNHPETEAYFPQALASLRPGDEVHVSWAPGASLVLPGAELPPGQGEEQRLRALNLLARHGDTEAH